MCHFIFVNPNPFHYAEQIDWCALLGITHAYLIYLTHVPYIMMAVHQTPLICSLLICNHCSMEHPFIQHHHLYILNYTILDFICQALFLQSTSQLQHQLQMNLDKIIE